MINSSPIDINELKKECSLFKEDLNKNLTLKKGDTNLKIKICGITSKEDLKAAENYGSDLIGFIHVKRSVRYIDIETIKSLSRILTDNNKGVLVLEPDNVEEALNDILNSNLRNIQLHSLLPGEINELIQSLFADEYEKEYHIVRAIGISQDGLSLEKIKEIRSFAELCQGILFDYQHQGKTGGTGREVSLNTAIKAAEISRSFNPHLEIYLAGGLTASRIKKEGLLIKESFDFVDFNSGLEDFPGKKNHIKIKNAIETVKKDKIFMNFVKGDFID